MVLPSLRPDPLLAAASVRARPLPRLGFRLPPTPARHRPPWPRRLPRPAHGRARRRLLAVDGRRPATGRRVDGRRPGGVLFCYRLRPCRLRHAQGARPSQRPGGVRDRGAPTAGARCGSTPVAPPCSSVAGRRKDGGLLSSVGAAGRHRRRQQSAPGLPRDLLVSNKSHLPVVVHESKRAPALPRHGYEHYNNSDARILHEISVSALAPF